MTQHNIHSDDPLEMIWAVREKMQEETNDMTDEEREKYYRTGSQRVWAEIDQYAEKENSLAR